MDLREGEVYFVLSRISPSTHVSNALVCGYIKEESTKRKLFGVVVTLTLVLEIQGAPLLCIMSTACGAAKVP